MSSPKFDAGTASEWLLPFPDDAIDRIAEQVVSDSPIPVPAMELLQGRIEVVRVEWPHSVDALMIWQHGTPAKVLIRERPPSFARRVRMTAAHELGHLVIPWHVGYGPEACSSDANGGHSVDYVSAQEAEARTFAGKLLLPHSQLLAAANGRSPGAFFEDLDRFEASPWATVLRMTQVLRPGFMFIGPVRDALQEDCFVSGGTRTSLTPAQARDLSVTSGTFVVGGREISWHLFADAEQFELPSDERRTSEILTSIIHDVHKGENSEGRTHLFRSYQGVMGSALSHGVFDTVNAVLRQARQAANTKIPLEVRSHPDWDTYVKKTVFNRARKLNLI